MQAEPRRSDTFRLLAALLAPAGWSSTPTAIPADQHVPLISASTHHLIAPALGWRLRGRPDASGEFGEFLEAMLVLNRDRNRQIADGLEKIGTALNADGIAPLLLKGAGHLATALFPEPGFRFIGDIDLLVLSEHLPEAQTTLGRMGFEQPAGVRPSRHHLPLLSHPDWGLGIELHHQPVQIRSVPIVDASAIFAGAQPCTFAGACFMVPSPAHRVLLAIVHDQIADGRHAHGAPGLRAMLDVATLQARFPDLIAWDEIEHRLGRAGRGRMLRDYLSLAATLMRMRTPLGCIENPSALARMEEALDRSQASRNFRLFLRTARAAAAKLRSSPEAQLEALQPKRWRERARRFNPSW